MEKIYITRDARETMKLGEDLGKLLSSGDFLALKGDLGAGKTAFTKGIAKGLGVTDEITSPTFTIIHEYQGDTRLIHIDTYRLDHPQELEDIGFNDYLSEGVVVMEWADRVRNLLPRKVLWVCFEILAEDRRKITIISDSRYYDEILGELSE
jgi:tRNA threonylcarbamoyladenosine biosynthesis protein TsaE